MGVHERPVLQGLLAREKEQGDPNKSLRDCMESMSTVQRGDQGKSILQIDNTAAVTYLWKEVGTQCKKLISPGRNILLKGWSNGLEHLCGVANLRADSLCRGRYAQKWSLVTPSCHRLSRQ